jgi:hypothetical protein
LVASPDHDMHTIYPVSESNDALSAFLLSDKVKRPVPDHLSVAVEYRPVCPDYQPNLGLWEDRKKRLEADWVVVSSVLGIATSSMSSIRSPRASPFPIANYSWIGSFSSATLSPLGFARPTAGL